MRIQPVNFQYSLAMHCWNLMAGASAEAAAGTRAVGQKRKALPTARPSRVGRQELLSLGPQPADLDLSQPRKRRASASPMKPATVPASAPARWGPFNSGLLRCYCSSCQSAPGEHYFRAMRSQCSVHCMQACQRWVPGGSQRRDGQGQGQLEPHPVQPSQAPGGTCQNCPARKPQQRPPAAHCSGAGGIRHFCDFQPARRVG